MTVIRVSGDLGSGKTTLCPRLAKALGYKYSYTGAIFRELAGERGLSIEAFYAQMVENPDLERSIDKRQETLMSKHPNLVVEGRVVPFLHCPFQTINVKIAVTPEEGIRRQLFRPENHNKTPEEMAELSEKRVEDERERYRALYGIDDYLLNEHFDIVIDTTDLNPEEAFELLMEKLQPLLNEELTSAPS